MLDESEDSLDSHNPLPDVLKIDVSIDNDLLISEVAERQLLWDKNLDDYSDRGAKKIAWKEVIEIVIPNYDELTKLQKKIMGDAVEKRWKHLRDAFLRSIRNEMFNSGLGSKKKKRKYIYHDQLKFLVSTFNPRTTTWKGKIKETNPEVNTRHCFIPQEIMVVKEEEEVEEEEEEEIAEPRSSDWNTRKNGTSITRTTMENHESQTQTPKPTDDGAPDDHQQFFSSILPMIRKFNEDQALHFRAEVINVIQNIKRGTY